MSHPLPRNSLLLDYVRSQRPDFSLAGVRHRKQARVVAQAARPLFEADKQRTVETWLKELRAGQHDVHGWLEDQMVAESISCLDPQNGAVVSNDQGGHS